MIRKSVLFIFLLPLLIFAQPKGKAIFIEVNQIPGDSLTTLYFTYKLPFTNLQFLKVDGRFTAGLNITIEAEKLEKIVARETSSKYIDVIQYDDTKKNNRFLQGMISMELSEGEYNLIPQININNTIRRGKLDPIPVIIEPAEKITFIHPLIVDNSKVTCGSNKYFPLTNLENAIPYSLDKYNLFIPVRDTAIKSIRVHISQNEESIIDTALDEYLSKSLNMVECGESIVVSEGDDPNLYNIFILPEFNLSLREGKTEITISSGELSKSFDFECEWVNKPLSLENPEISLELLSIITEESEVNEMLDNDEEDYENVLFDFWDKLNPRRKGKFNPLMKEFYERADYAQFNFVTTGKKEGVKTDRGFIYIKYGQPDEIKRAYSEKDNVLEIWKYNRIGKEFIFKDASGLGDYTLVQ